MGIFEKCLKTGRWPIHNDERPYHTIRYNGVVVRGNRNMTDRFDWLGIPSNLAGQTVLDIGCNVGEVSYQCCSRGATVYGFDGNRPVLTLAKQVHPGPHYMRANIDLYPHGFAGIKTRSYDLVFCLSIINHVKRKRLLKLLKDVSWKKLIFEGHQTTWKKERDAFNLFEPLGWRVEFVGISKERLPRPLWHVWKQ